MNSFLSGHGLMFGWSPMCVPLLGGSSPLYLPDSLPLLAVEGDGVVAALRDPKLLVELFLQPRGTIRKYVSQSRVSGVVYASHARDRYAT